MTWLRVNIHATATNDVHIRRKWCENNLSSNGVLWKHSYNEPLIFHFAQPQDLVIFKLMFG